MDSENSHEIREFLSVNVVEAQSSRGMSCLSLRRLKLRRRAFRLISPSAWSDNEVTTTFSG
jgi:hypothetical protein